MSPSYFVLDQLARMTFQFKSLRIIFDVALGTNSKRTFIVYISPHRAECLLLSSFNLISLFLQSTNDGRPKQCQKASFELYSE